MIYACSTSRHTSSGRRSNRFLRIPCRAPTLRAGGPTNKDGSPCDRKGNEGSGRPGPYGSSSAPISTREKIRRLWPGRLSINRLSVRTGKWPLVEVAALHDPICGAGPHSGNFSSGNRSDAGELLGSRLRHQSADKRRAHDGDVPDVWRTSGSQMSVSDVTERSHYCGFDPTNQGTWHRAIGLCQPAHVRIQ